ncbi:uncharacterized protein J4E92_010136 [Alternaria infectoria]|uniref:uncharacterized protein n=1 Tax=Alternaria infectoria TaxID=45303 RepID=UPI002221096F|nr:uncharacterized protein J4E92_010136 [Alternaria infectoria]KAI4912091.1 hypothetical protein J4E92_010136 [Alternaria infectoria]
MAPSSTSSSAPAGQHAPPNSSFAEPEKTTEYASIIPQPRSNENDQDRLQLQRTVSSVSHHDMANVQYIATGDNDVIYNKFTERRKMVIVAVVSFCSFLAPISSTTVLSAVPEVAETFDTDGSIINTERATALGWFLSGTLIGPALGPFIGGIIVTFRSWRDIFWLQTALAGAATLFCFFLQPETIHKKRADELVGLPTAQRAHKMWQWLNPFRVVKLYRYPNILLTALASSSLVWNMYSLLTPIRYVLNPRFDLQSPLQSGLFYIAPGCGYLLGTFFGGRYADHIVKKYIQRRGHRVSEDRLRSCVFFLGGVIPACMLIYGWSVEKRVGGIALPVVMMFLQGVAQLFCFPSLNTYCLDVMQGRSAEVVAGNYFMRYMFAAGGSAVCLPAVRAIGVGWFSTISAGFLVAGAGATWLTAVKGRGWREGIEERKAQRKEVALA